MRRSPLNGIRLAIVSSVAAQGTALAANLVAVPLFIAALGSEMYGFWGALLGITAYLRLLNFGIAQTVSSSVSRLDPVREADAIAALVRRGALAFLRLVAVAIPVAAGLAWVVPWGPAFGLGEHRADLAVAAALSAVTLLLDLPFSVARASLIGLGAVHLDRMIAIFVTLGRTAVAVVAAWQRPSLPILIILLYGIDLCAGVGAAVALIRRVPSIRRRVDLSTPGDPGFARTSRQFFVVQIAGGIVFGTDAFLAGTLLHVNDAARISITWRLMSAVLTVVSLLGPAMAPGLVRIWASGDRARAASILTDAARIASGLVLGIGATLAVSGRGLYGIWVGTDLFPGELTWALYLVLIAAQALTTMPYDFMMQAGSGARFANFTVAEATVKIALLLALVPHMGLAAMPLSTLCGRMVTFSAMLLAFAEELDTTVFVWLRQVAAPAFWPLTASAAVLTATRLQDWPAIPMGVLCAASYFAIWWFVGLTPDIRHRLLSAVKLRSAAE